MSHSLNVIWIHAIWSTKYRQELINPTIEKKLFQFMSDQFREQGCSVRIINGMPDHVHCLFRLCREKSISQVIKQVKGSSSHFVNQNNLIPEKFSWQTGYAAYSVSESIRERVFHYINNQKLHHLKKSFSQEYDDIVQLLESKD
jgi:putative transposase